MDKEKMLVLCGLISRQLGLHFHQNQLSSLERYLSTMAHALGIPDEYAHLHRFLSKAEYTDSEFEILSKNLTIGETYFFRENKGLALLSDEILPRLVRERRGKNQHIRIWSAGCSTGEEPYSLAMIVRDTIPDLHQWDIEILATDINLESLRKAQAGIFPAWSFRETTDVLKKKYFTEKGRHHEINTDIKKMVKFARLNLAKDSFPSPTTHTGNFDVIFCRNVLMYFLPSVAKKIAIGFFNSLNEESWLITSQVELNDDYFSLFTRRMYGQGIFYQKTEKKTTSHHTTTKSGRKELQQGAPSREVRKTFHTPASQVSTGERTTSRKAADSTSTRAKVAKPLQEDSAAITNTMEAAMLYSEARYSECAAWCEQYINKHQFDQHIAFLLIQSLANSGNLTEAGIWSEKFLSVDETSTEILFLYATILLEQNDPQGAEAVLIKTLYTDPAHLSATLYLANTMRKTGKIKQSLKYYNHLLHLLSDLADDDIVPAMDGMTAGRLRHMIELTAKE